jgi:hypothetical protein
MQDAQETSHDNKVTPIPINIFIGGKKFVAPKLVMTGAEIKQLGGIPPEYQLFLEVPGPKPDKGIRDDEKVELKSGMHFFGVVPGNLG